MKYYYNGQLFEDLLTEVANTSGKEVLEQISNQIDAYRTNEEHWEGKRKSLAKCTTISSYIAYMLFVFTAGRKQGIQALVAPMISIIKEESMSKEEAIKVASWFIEAGVGTLYSFTRTEDGLMVVSNYDLDSEEKEAASYMMYPPPESEPQEINYKLLGHNLNNHQGNIPYDVIEILQSIEWHLDPYICSMPEEANSSEFETREAEIQHLEQVEQSKRLRDSLIGKPMYFQWRFEKRLRQFMSGYHINLQSTKYKKACMSFGKPYKLTGEL